MKRPLAYLTAAWSGEPDVDMELATHYCRLAYEAGFSPICPLLYLPLFLNDSVPEAVSYTHLELCASFGFDTISNRNNDVKIVEFDLIGLSVCGSCCKFCNN